MMKLIKEINEDVSCFTEAKSEGGKSHYIQGIIMEGDITNRNGRRYPSKILAKEMERYNDTYVSKNRAYGELGHPDGPTINLERVSHIFTDLKLEGSNVVGKAKILGTPMGELVKTFINEGTQLGISSRGMGSVKRSKGGVMEVQEDFMLATAGDIVADPSAPNAFVEGIMENVDWVFDVAAQTWKSQQVFDQIEEEVKQTYSKIELEEKALRLFDKFFKSLS